jgi:hypothetical protein
MYSASVVVLQGLPRRTEGPTTFFGSRLSLAFDNVLVHSMIPVDKSTSDTFLWSWLVVGQLSLHISGYPTNSSTVDRRVLVRCRSRIKSWWPFCVISPSHKLFLSRTPAYAPGCAHPPSNPTANKLSWSRHIRDERRLLMYGHIQRW